MKGVGNSPEIPHPAVSLLGVATMKPACLSRIGVFYFLHDYNSLLFSPHRITM